MSDWPESDRLDDAPHPRQTYALFGHETAEQELLDAYRRNKMAQAWIIGGAEGIGKATLAWRMARFLLAHPQYSSSHVQQARSLEISSEHSAYRRINALALADIFLLRREWNEKTKKHFTEIRVDDVRKIIAAFHQASATDGWRIAIVDCADELNRSAANALLKLIEEPPDRSVFFLICHQPGRLLPTIRSRCRKLMLNGLSATEIASAITALGEPWSDYSQADIVAASARAEGSVREGLRLLDSDAMKFDQSIQRLFEKLPQIDWVGVHLLDDKISSRDNENAYETFMRALYRFIDQRIRDRSKNPSSLNNLYAHTQAWDEIRKLSMEAEVFNFDKKAMTVGIFQRLAKI